jgi:nitrate reductase NapE component
MERPGSQRFVVVMKDDELDDKRTGNEPAPLLLLAVALVPLLAIAAWMLGAFG